jgi:AraC-like DNA-binding protein
MVLVNVIKGENVSSTHQISSYKKGIKIQTNSVNDLITGDKVSLTGYEQADKDVRYKIVRLNSKTFYVPELAYNPTYNSLKEIIIKSPDKKISAITNIFFNLIILLYIIYSGQHAIKQKTILVLENEANESDSFDEKDKVLSESQRLIFEKIKEDLLVVIKTEKPYLDQNLNIFTLAKRLNTNSKYLSQVINHEFDKSFVHFVNEYRVEEAKAVLLSNNNYTIEAQSQMVGFKSKSAFNSAFKRHTGQTPSLFIQGNRR